MNDPTFRAAMIIEIQKGRSPEIIAGRLKARARHPYHSWEKGTVESRNGVIRRYLPRSIDLRTWTQDELDEIADDINNTPMKCLDFQTPNEFYSQCCIQN